MTRRFSWSHAFYDFVTHPLPVNWQLSQGYARLARAFLDGSMYDLEEIPRANRQLVLRRRGDFTRVPFTARSQPRPGAGTYVDYERLAVMKVAR